MEQVVNVEHLSCKTADGTKLLDDVSLKVRAGECVLLCGRSGAGKTMLTKCLNGLIPNFEPGITRLGGVSVCGKDPAVCEAYELAFDVGNVFQNPKSQFFNLTSDDELAFGLEVAGVDPDTIDERMAYVTDALAIENLRGRNVNHMSGGEKQSLVFASVAVADPALYILDEPTANLDHEATAKIRSQIEAALAEGEAVIVAEHRLDFIADLIDRALFINDGRIERVMTSEDLLSLTPEELEKMGLRSPQHGRTSAAHAMPRSLPVGDDGTPGLSVRNLTVARKKAGVFKPVSFDVAPGSVLGIIGANGAGKTTMLRALAGLERHAAGSVVLDGTELNRKQRRRLFAYVMQDVNHQLFSDSVRAECEMSLAAGIAPEEGQRRIDEVLEKLDLTDRQQMHPMALSGGQKQRLAIASCLLSGRQVLLMDEPTSGLDFSHMMEVTELIRGLANEGLIVCVVTHDGEFMERACDCAIEIGGGRD